MYKGTSKTKQEKRKDVNMSISMRSTGNESMCTVSGTDCWPSKYQCRNTPVLSPAKHLPLEHLHSGLQSFQENEYQPLHTCTPRMECAWQLFEHLISQINCRNTCLKLLRETQSGRKIQRGFKVHQQHSDKVTLLFFKKM